MSLTADTNAKIRYIQINSFTSSKRESRDKNINLCQLKNKVRRLPFMTEIQGTN